MAGYLQSPTAQIIAAVAGLLVVVMIGVYALLRYRDSIEEDEMSSDLLTKFREMRHEGYLNEDEYRTIKTDLENKLSQHTSAESDRLRRRD